jgi:DNA (cytosine-5)-methyltransferase 1
LRFLENNPPLVELKSAIQSLKVRRPVAVDLFAGAGGFSLGIEQAGFDVLVAVEYDPIHACTYSFNFPLTQVLCADISNVTGEIIQRAACRSWFAHQGKDAGRWRHGDAENVNESFSASESWDGQIDLVFGGPPCQGFSIMGKRNLDDDRNNLIFHFYRLVIELHPRYFVMENVPGMTAGEHKNLLSQLIGKFEAAGYYVQKEILNAANFGVPQKRRRLFLIGTRVSNSYSLVPSTQYPAPTVRDAIADLPDIDDFPELKTSDEVLLSRSQLLSLNEKSSPYVQMLRFHPNIGDSILGTQYLDTNPQSPIQNFSYPRLWNPQLLTSSMQTQHLDSSKIRFAKTLPGELEAISRLRRLDINGLCHTLRAGTDYSRGSHTSPRPIHPVLARVISVREAARLHSFPDWFRFHQTKWHGFRQVGNAVPPLLAQAIGEKLITALEIVPFAPQKFLELGNTQLLRLTFSGARNYWKVEK